MACAIEDGGREDEVSSVVVFSASDPGNPGNDGAIDEGGWKSFRDGKERRLLTAAVVSGLVLARRFVTGS